MAIFANITGRYVIQCFAGCVCTVVTARTIARDGGVIEIGRYPANSGVTAIAIVTACYMRWVFADRNRIVVTGFAGTNHLRMVHHQDWLPERCAVAVFADI